MLIEFRFKNFLSFRDECVFSMVASKDRTWLEENTASTEMFGRRRLLRTAVVYGANASGKTNLVKALGVVQDMVSASVERKSVKKNVIRFLLDDLSSEEPSEFELTLIEQGVRYQYGFILDDKEISEEWLYAFPKGQAQKWFVRSTNQAGDTEWEWGSQLKGEKRRLAGITRPDALFLSVAAQFNQRQLEPVHDWFSKRLQVIDAHDFPNLFTLRGIMADGRFKQQVEKLLQKADLGISEVRVEEKEIGTDASTLPAIVRLLMEGDKDGVSVLEANRWRKMSVSCLHETSRQGIARALPFSLESKGTSRVLALARPLIDTLERGTTLVVDEMDSSLHPMLVKSLVEMFHDPGLNKNNAQLIFNTHDTTLLSSDLFRRDQVWFTEKDEDGASDLYSLLEFKPRTSEALEKGYLQGKYGAVPILPGYADLLVGEQAWESSLAEEG